MTKPSWIRCSCCVAVLWGAVFHSGAATIHVPGGPPTIQAAIDASAPGDKIIVAPGTYNETINFLGKAITLCSSDGADVTAIDGSGFGSSVVTCATGEGPGTVLDGFTITGGAIGSPDGRGMYNSGASPTVSNCIFSQNVTALGNGGAIHNFQSDPTVLNCLFTENTATDGGAIYNNDSSPTVANCIFRDNHVFGGGNDLGGAVSNVNGSAPYFVNCVFTGNSSDHWGGAIANSLSGNVDNVRIVNCTFGGNTASLDGGAVYNNDSNIEIVNCILWNNSDSGGIDESAQIHDNGASVSTVTYSCIHGLSTIPGAGNIGDDPLWVDEPVGNLRLSAGSPAIDAGDTSALPIGLYVDLDGKGRVTNSLDVPDTGIPSLIGRNTVDMGAYEAKLGGLLGDVNGDGCVNISDLGALLANFGRCVYD